MNHSNNNKLTFNKQVQMMNNNHPVHHLQLKRRNKIVIITINKAHLKCNPNKDPRKVLVKRQKKVNAKVIKINNKIDFQKVSN